MASKKDTQPKKTANPPKKNEKEKEKQQEKQMTPKQAVTKATSLLRGIDNSTVIIKKHQEVIEQSFEQVKSLIAGIGNQPVAAPTAKPAAKSATKPATKPEQPAKGAKAGKATPKAAKKPVAKAVAKAVAKPSVDGQGPTIKEAAATVLRENGGTLSAADIWHKAQERYKRTWSRQVLYNALAKNPEVFTPADGGYKYGGVAKQTQTTAVKKDDKDVDHFIEKASKNEAVSSVL